MDGYQKQRVLIATIIALFFTTLAVAIVNRTHEDKILFIEHGYHQVSIPGVDGYVWQKAEKDTVK